MKTLMLVGLVVALFATPTLAGSMRCKGRLVVEGDTVSRMLNICGSPQEVSKSPSVLADEVVYIYNKSGYVRRVITARNGIIEEIR